MIVARPVRPRSLPDVAREWDEIAATRSRQLDERTDISFHRVLAPAIQDLLGDATVEMLLDVGCGTGTLTAMLATGGRRVTGVDVSVASIAEAQRRFGTAPGVTFAHSSIEDFSTGRASSFDTAVANMVLMTMPDLTAGLDAIHRTLRPGGLFVFTITHPWFWPTYWAYEEAPWFRYDEEIFIEAEFQISLEATGLTTTHIHRPLSHYSKALNVAGFEDQLLYEPIPVEARLPAEYQATWRFPRFLMGQCVKPLHPPV